MSTAFDNILDAFAAKLRAATPVSNFIFVDEYDEPLPLGQSEAVVVSLGDSDPQPLGSLAFNPVDWITQVNVKCLTSANATSPRPAAGTLAAAAYARLATDPSLGMDGVFIGEPLLHREAEQAATRLATCTLTYSVHHRTTGLTLA
jgi:hypothetical protein